MVIAQRFRKDSETAIASYNYIDIAEGTGVIAFNLGLSAIDGTDTYMLSTNSFYSQETATEIDSAHSPKTLNFDLTVFNLPQTLKGTAYLNIGLFNSANVASCTVRIIRVRGVDSTNVSSLISLKMPVGDNSYLMAMTPIPLTQTHFKKGDVLRCQIIMTNPNGNFELGHDPMGRNGDYLTSALTSPPVTTISKLFIPFRLDL